MARNSDYTANKITIQSSERWEEIEEWNEYRKEKKQIQDKYPSKPWITSDIEGRGNYKNPFEQEWWDAWCKYKNEIADLLLKPEGNFDKFLWKIVPEREELIIKTWMRGRYNTETYMKTRNRNDRT